MLIGLGALSGADTDSLDSLQIDNYNYTQDNTNTLSSSVNTDSTSQNNTEYSKAITKNNSNIKTTSKHTTKMTVSNSIAYVSSNVNLIATVADKTTNTYATGGTVVFKVNGLTVGNTTLINGKATYKYSTSALSAKNYTISASYSGYGIYSSAKTTSNATLTLMPIATKMSLNSPSAYSTTVLLKATVVDKVNGKYIPDGQVVFKINGNTIGTSNITNGKASYTYNASDLYAGKYNISAVYSGTHTYSSYRVNSTLTIKTQSSFTLSQIMDAAVDLRTQYEANNIINYIRVSNSKLHVQDFLYLMTTAVKNINKGNTSSISYKSFKAATSQTDTLKTGKLTKSEYLSLAGNIISYMNSKSIAPSSMSTSLGSIGYYNMIYIYTKILDVSTSSYLVSTCSVYNWKKLHPSNSTARHIYISSDNIYSTSKDTAFVNKIKSILESKGYTVSIIGIGPNTHNTKIWDESLPINAVELAIFGGADAGVIRDVCTRSFMRTKANRMIFFAYHSGTSTDITGLSWLKRSSDDNYSPSSFTGIAYPDIYLKSHGYDYVYTSNANTIVNSLIEYIS